MHPILSNRVARKQIEEVDRDTPAKEEGADNPKSNHVGSRRTKHTTVEH